MAHGTQEIAQSTKLLVLVLISWRLKLGLCAQPPNCRKDGRKWMYDLSRMYADVRFVGGLRGGGGVPAFFWLLRAEAARLVLKLRAASCWGAAGCPPAISPGYG
jgi:hypothetical protein